MRTHQEKILAHGAARLAGIEQVSDPVDIDREFRRFLKIEDQRLRIADRCGASGRWIANARSAVLDLLRTQAKTNRSATNWLAVGNSLSQISCQPQFRGASQWDTSLVLNSLESKRAGHRLQSGSLADHNCVALGIMRGKIVAPCRLAGEETEQSHTSIMV